MDHTYRTIQDPSEAVYKEKGSKFLAFAYPVKTEEEVKEKIEHLKKEFFDARHHCFAWVIGSDKKHFRAFDDGEPNHSAGDSILGQIRSKNITNTLIVVVRYFGGTKLGVGGLITAYKTAAEEVLNNCTIIEKEIMKSFCLVFSYESTSEVMRLVKDFSIEIISQNFTEACVLDGAIRIDRKEALEEKINLLEALRHKIKLEI